MISVLQLPVDPADQIPLGNVTNEQKKRIGGLVQSPVSQNKFRQRTAPDVLGFGTRPTDLVVPAVMEMPVALELRTTGTAIQAALDAAPSRPPVLYHVAIGYVVRDALIADRGHQPVAPRTSATTSTKRGRAIIGNVAGYPGGASSLSMAGGISPANISKHFPCDIRE